MYLGEGGLVFTHIPVSHDGDRREERQQGTGGGVSSCHAWPQSYV